MTRDPEPGIKYFLNSSDLILGINSQEARPRFRIGTGGTGTHSETLLPIPHLLREEFFVCSHSRPRLILELGEGEGT